MGVCTPESRYAMRALPGEIVWFLPTTATCLPASPDTPDNVFLFELDDAVILRNKLIQAVLLRATSERARFQFFAWDSRFGSEPVPELHLCDVILSRVDLSAA